MNIKGLLTSKSTGIDFFDALAILEGPHIMVPSVYAGGEERFLAVGLLEGRYVTVVYTIETRRSG